MTDFKQETSSVWQLDRWKIGFISLLYIYVFCCFLSKS